MTPSDITICKKISKNIIDEVEKVISLHKKDKSAGNFIKIGADGTPTKKIDEYAEGKVIEILKKADFYSYLISEEIGELILGNGIEKPMNMFSNHNNKERSEILNKLEFLFIVDPLDGTNNALKNIPTYGISIAIAKIKNNNIALTLEDIEVSFVKDLYSGDLIEAVKNQGAKINGELLKPSEETEISKITLGGYISLEDEIFQLLEKIRRMRLLGAVAIESTYITQGKYEVFMDLRGSRIIDIAASKLIIEESGAIITDRYGNKLKNKLKISEKVAIVGSCNKTLHNKVIKYLDNSEEKKLKYIGKKNNPIKSFSVVSRLDKEETILFAGKIIQDLINNNFKVQINESLAKKLEEFRKSNNTQEILKKLPKNEFLYDTLQNLQLKIDFSKLSSSISNFEADVVITFGGDGTILMTQNQLKTEIPIFSINMGTVGFLTSFSIEDSEKKLKKLIEGEYCIEKRTQVKVSHGNKLFSALNEVVIMTENPAKMLHFKVEVDGEAIEDFRADGLILSTPSGSTAYSMSAGGPILDPKVEAFIIIPICPYKLGIRPFVVSDNSEIKIKLLQKGKKAILVMDGQINQGIEDLDEIMFKKSEQYAYFIKTGDSDFYQKVKEKLIEG
jgi:NAD+ kinase